MVPYLPANITGYRFWSECSSLDIDAISWQWSAHHLRHRPNPFSAFAWIRRAATVSIRSGSVGRHRKRAAYADSVRCWRYPSANIHSHGRRPQFGVGLCVGYPRVAMPLEHFSGLSMIPTGTHDTQWPSQFSFSIHCKAQQFWWTTDSRCRVFILTSMKLLNSIVRWPFERLWH